MDRPHTIQVPSFDPPEPNWQLASKIVRPKNNVLFVEMYPHHKQIGRVVLPSTVGGHLRPDAGTVIAAGYQIDEVKPGEKVLVLPYNGSWFSDVKFGAYESENELRVYGIASKNEKVYIEEDWNLSVIAVMEDKRIRPVGQWCLIRRDSLIEKSSGGIQFTEKEKYRSQLATVVYAGTRCTIQDGSRTMYRGQATVIDLAFLKVRYPELEGDGSDYAFIKECDLYGVVDETVTMTELATIVLSEQDQLLAASFTKESINTTSRMARVALEESKKYEVSA